MTDATELDEAAVQAAIREHVIRCRVERGYSEGNDEAFASTDATFLMTALDKTRTDLPAALDEITRLRAALDEARGNAADAHHEGFGAGVAFADAAGRLADFLESTWRTRAEAAGRERDEAMAEAIRQNAQMLAVQAEHEEALMSICEHKAATTDMRQRKEAAESALAAVQALHQPRECRVMAARWEPEQFIGIEDGAWCDTCNVRYPCPTSAALATPTTTERSEG